MCESVTQRFYDHSAQAAHPGNFQTQNDWTGLANPALLPTGRRRPPVLSQTLSVQRRTVRAYSRRPARNSFRTNERRTGCDGRTRAAHASNPRDNPAGTGQTQTDPTNANYFSKPARPDRKYIYGPDHPTNHRRPGVRLRVRHRKRPGPPGGNRRI